MDKNVQLRLRQERLRLGKNQAEVAEFCAVSSKTVSRWEKNIAIPADKLSRLGGDGFDVLFVLTGRHELPRGVSPSHSLPSLRSNYGAYHTVPVGAGDDVSEEPSRGAAEAQLLRLFKGLSEQQQGVVLAMMAGLQADLPNK